MNEIKYPENPVRREYIEVGDGTYMWFNGTRWIHLKSGAALEYYGYVLKGELNKDKKLIMQIAMGRKCEMCGKGASHPDYLKGRCSYGCDECYPIEYMLCEKDGVLLCTKCYGQVMLAEIRQKFL